MKWFKHFSGARKSDGIEEVMKELGTHFGYACYWLLTEFLAESWDGKSEPVFKFTRTRLANELRIKPGRVQLVLNSFSTHSELEVSCDGQFFIIKHPKLRDIKDEYARKSGHTPDTVRTVEEDKETDKDKETNTDTDYAELELSSSRGAVASLQGQPEIEKAMEGIKHSTQNAWTLAYPDLPWIRQEILKALAWLETNPKKRPKNFARFMGNWFSRGWEQYRKSLPTNRPGGATIGIAAIRAEREAQRVV